MIMELQKKLLLAVKAVWAFKFIVNKKEIFLDIL